LEPLYRFTQGSISIEIYGGYREIGGNCAVIRDGDRKLVLDNGIRFSILRIYYRGGLQPLGGCRAQTGWRCTASRGIQRG
jgi:ribonuclease J